MTPPIVFDEQRWGLIFNDSPIDQHDAIRRVTLLQNQIARLSRESGAELTKLRADVARLTEENRDIQRNLDALAKQATALEADKEYNAELCLSLRAERDALRQGIAQFRDWLADVVKCFDGRAHPSVILGQLDTLLPPGEAT